MAARHLQAAGYTIVARNFRSASGEMDLVATRTDTWVFVEVKTRRGDAYGKPEDAVTPAKAARLITVAQEYLQEHGLDDVDWQIWIDAGELAVPRRMVINYKNQPGYPRYAAALNYWRLSTDIPQSTFVFNKPEGAKLVEMNELLGIAEGQEK